MTNEEKAKAKLAAVLGLEVEDGGDIMLLAYSALARINRLQAANEKYSAALGAINHHCITAMPECNGQALELVVGKVTAELSRLQRESAAIRDQTLREAAEVAKVKAKEPGIFGASDVFYWEAYAAILAKVGQGEEKG